jgi:hypothetical protein
LGISNGRNVQGAPFFSGQKSGLPPQTIKPTDCEIVRNFLTLRGQLERIPGTTLYGTIIGSGRITWIDRLAFTWFAQRGTEIFLESGQDTGSFNNILDLTSDDPIVSDKYKLEMYMTNGTDFKVYNYAQASNRNLGLQSPISPTALNGADTNQITKGTNGSLNDQETYKCTFTYYDPANNIESPAVNVRPNESGLDSDLSAFDYWSIALGSGEDEFTIKATYLQTIFNNTYNGNSLIDTNATKIRVYVTGDGSSVRANIYRLYGEYTISGLTDINVTSEATGVLLPTDNIPAPSVIRQQESYFTRYGLQYTGFVGYKSIRFFRDSLFGFGASGVEYPGTVDQTYDSILYIHEPFQPDYVFDTREVACGDGQRGIGVAVLRDSALAIFKERSTYYLSGTSPDTYVVRVMDPRRGAVAVRTIQETPYGIFALDNAGVIQVDAIGPIPLVSEDIEDVIRTINFAAISTAYSGYDARDSRYYLAVPTEGSGTPNKTLVYKADDKTWSIIEGQEGGSISFGFSSVNEPRNIIGTNTNGRVLRFDQETVVDNIGTAINSEYLSGPFYGSDPGRKKKAKFLYITAESASDWTITIGIVPDFGQGEEYILENLNSNSLFSVYASSQADTTPNVGVFDESLWAANKLKSRLRFLCMVLVTVSR